MGASGRDRMVPYAGNVADDRSGAALQSRRVKAWILSAVAAAAFLLGLGYLLGLQRSGTEWHEGAAYVGREMASLQTSDWTYGVSESVAWMDERGEHHDSGWPSCLDVPPGTAVDKVRFAAVDVEVDGLAWREVLAVDCSTR